jgi:hypothetical protein
MTRCLDEAKLQSYFDGELSIEMMESVTSHLAACVTCAAAAREVEQESALFMEALSAELETSVPTERLRERIDAAVLGERVAVAQSTQKAGGLTAFFSGLLNFGTQRTLGYASLAVVLAFAAILGVVKMKSSNQSNNNQTAINNNPALPKADDSVAVVPPTPIVNTSSDDDTTNAKPVEVVTKRPERKAVSPRPSQVVPSMATNAPVKLLPGERSYLQTIARLDSSIKSGKKDMRPSLRAEYEHNLAVVDRAIAATRSAAKSNPTDPDTADFMFAAYQSKVDLLNTIADARLGGRGH